MNDMKIIVLDDDPTGIQTVHGIYVYTHWDRQTIREAFLDPNPMFFILTNSRSFSEEETIKAHREIGSNIQHVADELEKEFIIVSRGDSTLRGHYPLETEILKETLAEREVTVDGEVFCPFFIEGGRVTKHGVHYIQEGDGLIPVGETEFAKDKTFGYQHSNLGAFIEEKTKGRFLAKDCIYIDVELLRQGRSDTVYQRLMEVNGFNKVIVDSMSYEELQVFVEAFIKAIASGKRFLIRSAAGLTKILGNISDKALLTRKDIRPTNTSYGGIILIGSHVKKTTEQLVCLEQSGLDLTFIEFNAETVKVEGGLEAEVDRIVQQAQDNILHQKTTVVYTSRTLIDLGTKDKEAILKASVRISGALTSIIGRLSIQPSFVLAKGGITSSDVGTKALKVNKALVLGQIKPGIPVWKTDADSKFPGMPYIIFPGNVGTRETLKEIVEIII